MTESAKKEKEFKKQIKKHVVFKSITLHAPIKTVNGLAVLNSYTFNSESIFLLLKNLPKDILEEAIKIF